MKAQKIYFEYQKINKVPYKQRKNKKKKIAKNMYEKKIESKKSFDV